MTEKSEKSEQILAASTKKTFFSKVNFRALLVLLLVFGLGFVFGYYAADLKLLRQKEVSPGVLSPASESQDSKIEPEDEVVQDLRFYLIKNDGSVYVKGNVYHPDLLVEGADAETFHLIVQDSFAIDSYFADKNSVYNTYHTNETGKLENSDPSTFRLLSEQFAVDKNQAYFTTWTEGGSVFHIFDADTDSFLVVNNSVAKDKDSVYYGNYSGVRLIPNADPASVTAISGGFIKDKKNVYYTTVPIVGADPDYFEIVGYAIVPYCRDRNSVFYCTGWAQGCSRVAGADPGTFRISQYEEEYYMVYVVMDKNYLYHDGQPIPNSDAATFEYLGKEGGKDRNQTYRLDCEMYGCGLSPVE